MRNEPSSFQPDINATTPIDEHDEPTEPIRQVDIAAFVPTIPASSFAEEDVPSAKSATQPFPQHYVQPPAQSSAHHLPPPNVYPYLPARKEDFQANRPAGGAAPVQSTPVPVSIQARKGRMIPIAVGMCFVAVQALLLLRFVFKLLAFSSDISWVAAVYGVSNIFILPFRVLFLQFSIPLFGTIELYTLLAILVYGVVSRIVVRILKLFFKTR